MRIVDLTHELDDSIPVYPGDPQTRIIRLTDVSASGYTLSEVRTGMHAGTHMDGPLHIMADAKNIAELPIERFVGRGIVIDARKKGSIGRELLCGVQLLQGDIVLVSTGFDEKFKRYEYYTEYPEVTPSFADALVEAGVSILGLDTPGPDREPFNIHKRLLSSGVLIIENLRNLDSLLGVEKFEVIALPAKYCTEAAPVRVIARIADC